MGPWEDRAGCGTRSGNPPSLPGPCGGQPFPFPWGCQGLTAAAVEVAAEGLEALDSAPLLSTSPYAHTVRRSREAELPAVAGRLEGARKVLPEGDRRQAAGSLIPGMVGFSGAIHA